MKRMSRERKYVLLVGDGMPDYPLEELDGRTPLEVAATPNMDRVAACRIGLAQTIPSGMEAGSDVANLSLLGYDPRRFHTGRSPLEAASMGVHLAPSEVAFRMNLVTLDFRSDDEIIMISHSSGDIPQAEAAEIVASLKQEIKIPDVTIYPGVAYRNPWFGTKVRKTCSRSRPTTSWIKTWLATSTATQATRSLTSCATLGSFSGATP